MNSSSPFKEEFTSDERGRSGSDPVSVLIAIARVTQAALLSTIGVYSSVSSANHNSSE